ncbi:hypothetical protein PFLUOLIPICF7_12050 [Pseudomonas simiae]|jgi:hypothetical protein|uniref:Uncharacterized protein n=1 Tax=Pseudomonas simiae TaxID=321846 RepID=U1SSC5_9PSED|nr:hypothetical protein PFLUOLIPICF7_12050 [Pseudomonas simiae]ERH49171.1 hypothetical protein O204_10355 [Pseudomonas simiae]
MYRMVNLVNRWRWMCSIIELLIRPFIRADQIRYQLKIILDNA